MLWLASPIVKYIAFSIVIIVTLGAIYRAIWNSGYEAASDKYRVSLAQTERANNLAYQAAMKRGDIIIDKYNQAMDNLYTQKAKYEKQISDLRGISIPAELVRVSNDAGSNTGAMPETASNTITPATAVNTDAGDFAETVVENYTRANACINQLNSLIDFETGKP
jgi:hypothetical protein